MTLAPLEKPMKKLIARFVTEESVPTAEKEFFPTKLPTTQVSTVLYSCWKRLPRKSGRAKETICGRIDPAVMSISRRFPNLSDIPILRSVYCLFPSA